jgi:hypothetical protein
MDGAEEKMFSLTYKLDVPLAPTTYSIDEPCPSPEMLLLR